MKIKGTFETREITIEDKRLDPHSSQAVYNHSPDGFAWGYGGSGPAQLALAILLIVTKQDLALQLHQNFKQEIIAPLPQSDFEIEVDVEAWINEKMNVFAEFMY